jgi:hypothetical protein
MTQQPFEHVSFDKPNEVRQGENWRADILNLASGAQVGRLTIQPGFRWTEHVKPVAGTELCMAPHQQYHVRGRIHILMADAARLKLVLVKFSPYLRATLPRWLAMSPRSQSTGRARPSGGGRFSFVAYVACGTLCACLTRMRRRPTSICARPI